jgi:beta-phosphoglucomutase-like phosphatase (HAD superfamily)
LGRTYEAVIFDLSGTLVEGFPRHEYEDAWVSRARETVCPLGQQCEYGGLIQPVVTALLMA